MKLKLVRKDKRLNDKTVSFLRTNLLRLKGSQLGIKMKLIKIEKNSLLRAILG